MIGERELFAPSFLHEATNIPWWVGQGVVGGMGD